MARLGRSFPVSAAVWTGIKHQNLYVITIGQAQETDTADTTTWIPSPPVGKIVQIDASALIRAAFW